MLTSLTWLNPKRLWWGTLQVGETDDEDRNNSMQLELLLYLFLSLWHLCPPWNQQSSLSWGISKGGHMYGLEHSSRTPPKRAGVGATVQPVLPHNPVLTTWHGISLGNQTGKLILFHVQDVFKCEGPKHVIFNRKPWLVGTISFCNPSFTKLQSWNNLETSCLLQFFVL